MVNAKEDGGEPKLILYVKLFFITQRGSYPAENMVGKSYF